MSYLFKSKAAGDVLMLKAGGDELLRIIGKVPAARGIIEPAAMPAAIQAIEEAVAGEQAEPPQAEGDEDGPHDGGLPGDGVSLRQRAWPLLQMLRSAHAAGQDIVWGV